MKTLLKFLAIVALLTPMPALAQSAPTSALVVSSCGGQSYPVGTAQPVTQDTTGNTCSTGGGGGGGETTITAPLGNQATGASVSTTNSVGSTLAPAVVALSTTAGQVLASGSSFVSRVVCNDDASITEYFGPSSVTNAGANGVKVLPGQCWDFSRNTAAIYGVSASATPNARVVQY